MLTVQNFLQNSLHLRNDALVSKVWEAISAEICNKVWLKCTLCSCSSSHNKKAVLLRGNRTMQRVFTNVHQNIFEAKRQFGVDAEKALPLTY